MQELTEEQKRPQLTGEVAGISADRDITRYYGLPLLIPQDETLNLKGGYGIEALKIYEKVLENHQVRSCYQQRFRKLTRCQWEVTPASQSRADKKAADWLRELCANMPMDSITEQMLYGVHYGYSIAEKMLIREGNTITLDLHQGGIRVRNRRRFRFDTKMRPRLITINNQYEGELLPESRIWNTSFGGDNADDPYGRGLANSLYWLDLFQRGDMRHWLKFLDNTSARNAIVKYPSNDASPAEKELALKLAIALKDGKPVSMAEGLIHEIIEAAGSGTANFEGLYDRCDSAIAKVILSQSGTTDNGAWAGTAESHENVADDVVASDGDMFSQSFMRHVAKPLCFYNFPDAETPICAYKTVDEENINTRIDRDKKLFDLGVKPTPELIGKVYGEGYEYIANQTLLNGAQLQALTQMITAASLGQMNPESLKEIMVNTMGVPIEAAEAIVAPIRNQPQPQILAPQDATLPNQIPTQGQNQNNDSQAQNSAPDLTALFSETLDFASKNCSKGLACGNTCISAKKKCKKSLNAQEKAYASKVTGGSGSTASPLTEKYPKLSNSEGDLFSKDSKIGKNTVMTTINQNFFQDEFTPPPTMQIIGIEVNGGYSKNSKIEGKDGLKLALASREHVRDYVKNAPDGTILANSPFKDDGFGDQRARLYEKAGFSPTNSDNMMYSIVSGGKNVPITLEEIIELKNAGHISK